MEKLILEQIQGIEREHDVRVLLAVESGSRAWGFESKNSDWDVRLVYVHRPRWYFMVEPQRDVIEVMDGDIDLVGWELRKSLALLRRCNPSLLEWIHSPIVYRADEDFVGRIRSAAAELYNPIASMYHYNRMYVRHDERYLQKESCNMKRFLYYLRGVLACKWIDANRTLPPIAFRKLMDATVEDSAMRARIEALIRLKKDGEEHDIKVVDKELMVYTRSLADYYNEKIGTMHPEQKEYSTGVLDDILYDMVFAW
jgi:predicted nucleotidyltransferase